MGRGRDCRGRAASLRLRAAGLRALGRRSGGPWAAAAAAAGTWWVTLIPLTTVAEMNAAVEQAYPGWHCAYGSLLNYSCEDCADGSTAAAVAAAAVMVVVAAAAATAAAAAEVAEVETEVAVGTAAVGALGETPCQASPSRRGSVYTPSL